VGDRVKTTIALPGMPRGVEGRVVGRVTEDKVLVRFSGVRFLFNYWSDELEVTKRRR
jgi:hypothetical protein